MATAKKAPAKKAAAKKAEPPKLKKYYDTVSASQMVYVRKDRVPTKKDKWTESAFLKGTNLAALTSSVQAFAKKHGVAPEEVKIRQGWNGREMYVVVDESDAYFEKRVMRIKKRNDAIDAYRADLKRIEDYNKAQEAERAKARKVSLDAERAAAEAEVRKGLRKEIEAKMRNDAKLLAAITDEVLSDEKFIAGLRRLITESR